MTFRKRYVAELGESARRIQGTEVGRYLGSLEKIFAAIVTGGRVVVRGHEREVVEVDTTIRKIEPVIYRGPCPRSYADARMCGGIGSGLQPDSVANDFGNESNAPSSVFATGIGKTAKLSTQ